MTANAQPETKPKQRRRKEARPSEIIEAGLAEFADKGFAGARLEDVARRAGVVKGTIYRYFESKEALFEAAVRSRILVTLDEIETRIDTFPGSSSDLLQLLLKAVYERLVASPQLRTLMRIMIAEGARFPELTALYHRDTVTTGRRLLGRIVDRGIARGEFREGAVTAEPMVLIAPAIMAALWRITFERHEPFPLDEFQKAHLELVTRGLAKSKS